MFCDRFSRFPLLPVLLVALTPATTTGLSMADEPSTPAPAAKLDETEAHQVMARIERELNQSPGLLIDKGRTINRETRATLEYATKISKLTVRENLLEKSAAESIAAAKKAEESRKQLRARLDADMEEIKRRLADDKPRMDRELLDVIGHYRPGLQQLKTDQESLMKMANEFGATLVTLRRDREELERRRRLAVQQAPPVSGPTPPSLVSLFTNEPERTKSAPAPSAAVGESVEDALKSLEDKPGPKGGTSP